MTQNLFLQSAERCYGFQNKSTTEPRALQQPDIMQQHIYYITEDPRQDEVHISEDDFTSQEDDDDDGIRDDDGIGRVEQIVYHPQYCVDVETPVYCEHETDYVNYEFLKKNGYI